MATIARPMPGCTVQAKAGVSVKTQRIDAAPDPDTPWLSRHLFSGDDAIEPTLAQLLGTSLSANPNPSAASLGTFASTAGAVTSSAMSGPHSPGLGPVSPAGYPGSPGTPGALQSPSGGGNKFVNAATAPIGAVNATVFGKTAGGRSPGGNAASSGQGASGGAGGGIAAGSAVTAAAMLSPTRSGFVFNRAFDRTEAPWYQDVEPLILPPSNLSVFHHVAWPYVTADGILPLPSFQEHVLPSFVPPGWPVAEDAARWYTMLFQSKAGSITLRMPAATAPSTQPISAPPDAKLNPAGAAAVARSAGVAGMASPHNASDASAATKGDDPKSPTVGSPTFSAVPPPVIQSSGPVTAEHLPYSVVLSGLADLFTGEDAIAIDWSFQLCDVGQTGFILKSTVQHLRTIDVEGPASADRMKEEREAAAGGRKHRLASAVAAGQAFVKRSSTVAHQTAEEKAKDARQRLSVCSGAVLVNQCELPTMIELARPTAMPPGMNFSIIQALARAFDHVSAEEIERAIAAQKKGKKKKKKVKDPKLAGKRQFHVGYAQFQRFMQNDPHMVVAFIHHAIKTAADHHEHRRASRASLSASMPTQPGQTPGPGQNLAASTTGGAPGSARGGANASPHPPGASLTGAPPQQLSRGSSRRGTRASMVAIDTEAVAGGAAVGAMVSGRQSARTASVTSAPERKDEDIIG